MIKIGRNAVRTVAVLVTLALVLATPPISARAEQASSTDSTPANIQDAVMKDNISINGKNVGGMTYDQVIDALGGSLSDFSASTVTLTSEYGDVVTTLGDLGLSNNTEKVVKEAFEYGNSGNVLKRYKDIEELKTNPKNYTVAKTIDQNKLKQVVENNIGSKMEGLNDYNLNKAEDGSISVTTEGQAVSVDAKATVSAVEKIINEDGYSGSDVSTAVVVSDNSKSERQQQLARIKNLLGTYTTSYASSGGARKTNVQRAASLVDGHVLFPGDQISVYNCIAPIEVSNGYELAHAYVGTEVVDSAGGGVCQVATTLYNAVIRAELNVIQRNCHSMKVSYVPISADAAIAGGVLDLKFSNNLEAPIYIEAGYDGANLTFNIYGEEYRPSNRTIEFESIQTGVINPPDEPIVTEDKSLPPGTEEVTQAAVTGYTGELWKYVFVDGVKTDSIKINSSRYQASPAKISVNNDPAEPGEEELDEDDNGENPEETDAPKKKKKKEKEPEEQGPVVEPETPSEEPTEQPTETPTEVPTEQPTEAPTEAPQDVEPPQDTGVDTGDPPMEE